VLVPLSQVLLAGLFAVSACVPVGGDQGTTLLGFEPGSKNPNTRWDVRSYGFPVPWLMVTHSVNDAYDIDRWTYSVGSPLVPLSAVLIAVCFPLALGTLALTPRPGRIWDELCWVLSAGGTGVLAVAFVIGWVEGSGIGPAITSDLALGTESFRFDPLITLITGTGFLVGGVFARVQIARHRVAPTS
jgi:hypothetical protein